MATTPTLHITALVTYPLLCNQSHSRERSKWCGTQKNLRCRNYAISLGIFGMPKWAFRAAGSGVALLCHKSVQQGLQAPREAP